MINHNFFDNVERPKRQMTMPITTLNLINIGWEMAKKDRFAICFSTSRHYLQSDGKVQTDKGKTRSLTQPNTTES